MSESLLESLQSLSSFLIGDHTVRETLERVLGAARKTIPGVDFAGLTLLRDGDPTTAVSTDEFVADIDAAQYETGSGPCLDAYRDAATYRVDSTGDEQRWPEFCASAVAKGIHSVLAAPLEVNGGGIGGLNLYSCARDAFTADDEILARVFAAQAALVIANSTAYWDARNTAEQLDQAMRSRATIEQAKGILIASGAPGPDKAFDMLVHASQRENRKLREIAEDIVRRASERNSRAHA